VTEDIINQLSQSNTEPKSTNTPTMFPEIPDPPPGFDPEAEVLFKDDVPHGSGFTSAPSSKGMTPKAQVFMVGTTGNPEYEDVLRRGLEGTVVLGKKEVTDFRGSDKFKVYLEWIELPAKAKGGQKDPSQ
jgi:hypothetical protein